MIIVGITGTLGAGKGEVVSYLKSKGFAHFSARAFLAQEVARRGAPMDRPSMTDIADELRRSHSPSYIIEQLYAQAVVGGKNAILESVRTPGEVDFLKGNAARAHGDPFYLIAIDADPALRFERITHRKSALDNVSFEKFISDERREMDSKDPNEGNISECIRRADFILKNNGTLAELAAQIDAFLPQIIKPK